MSERSPPHKKSGKFLCVINFYEMRLLNHEENY